MTDKFKPGDRVTGPHGPGVVVAYDAYPADSSGYPKEGGELYRTGRLGVRPDFWPEEIKNRYYNGLLYYWPKDLTAIPAEDNSKKLEN